ARSSGLTLAGTFVTPTPRTPDRSSGRTRAEALSALTPRRPERSSGRTAAGAGSANASEATTTNAGAPTLPIVEFFIAASFGSRTTPCGSLQNIDQSIVTAEQAVWYTTSPPISSVHLTPYTPTSRPNG